MQYNVARKLKPPMNQLNSNEISISSTASSNYRHDEEDLTWFGEFKSMIDYLRSCNEIFGSAKAKVEARDISSMLQRLRWPRATGSVIKSVPMFFNWNKNFCLLRFDLKPVSE